MTTTSKPDMTLAWANSGLVTKPSDTVINSGWIAEKPPFQTENWIQNRADLYLKHLEERGVPQWDQQIIYSLNSLVYFQETVWISLTNSNLNNSPIAGSGSWIPLQEMSSPPGLVQVFAGASAPLGWLICNGAEINRITFARLFSFIGIAYGAGDGSTTFLLPDLVDKAVIGAGAIAGLADNVGQDTNTLSVSNMPAHNHGGGDHAHSLTRWTAGAAIGLSYVNVDTGDSTTEQILTEKTKQSGAVINTQGSGVAFTNIQRSMGMNWIIKT